MLRMKQLTLLSGVPGGRVGSLSAKLVLPWLLLGVGRLVSGAVTQVSVVEFVSQAEAGKYRWQSVCQLEEMLSISLAWAGRP